MPHFIDIHVLEGADGDAVARAHAADVAVQDQFGVRYIKYWFNESRGKIFCLCDAPNAEAANQVHRSAHGMTAERIIEVDPDLAEGFLGGGTIAPSGAVYFPESERCDPGVRTIVFTDIVGSTAMTQRMGDQAAMAVLDVHDRIVRRALSMMKGREVKHLGDGIMAVFTSAFDAVRCASLIEMELGRHAAQNASEPVRIRIGIASGEPVERNGDFFGSAVQLAARLCAHAQPGQTLVSTAVIELCEGKEISFVDLGEASLKGFEGPVRVHGLGPDSGQGARPGRAPR